MNILLVADGRSTITHSWLECIAAADEHIDLISTFPCEKPAQVERMLILPVAFSALAGGQVTLGDQKKQSKRFKKKLSGLRSLLLNLRYRWGPGTLPFFRQRYVDFVEQCQPDVVHALRIPFEGMLASYTPAQFPLVVSTWGNDLTLHACGSRRMARWTTKALQRADGLMADATRDLELARDFGYRDGLPRLMVPGNGGVNLDVFRAMSDPKDRSSKPTTYQVINPRGFRPGSVHQDVFFQSIPLIRKEIPDIRFICTAMQGQPQAERFVRDLGIADNVLLLPYLSQSELWSLYKDCDIYISLSSHDGTPNTFLEAIACGCFPVVGDIASLRQWIRDEHNGLLVNPLDVEQVASAIVRALRDAPMRQTAKITNWNILLEKADRNKVHTSVMVFYRQLID
ncbi:MAG TPA: hypothetical protein DCK95_01380 [Anaerolineaceae bacterium]|uniref:Putative glycosyltransferase n=1 Tax=Anaerolinea thermophila TaxID=167964 RepID=A0A101FYH9_9CHLR|nr:MAG: Putative glycosyltransferase [Anaerolinea thermophila]HAF60960.1 hypothetical protein [Anaerolineaceae bacterium]